MANTYTADQKLDIAKRVLELISTGHSLTRSCNEVGVPQQTFSRWVIDGSINPSDYSRARESCADSQFSEMDDLERQVLAGEIDPQTYRVVMDSRKWRLARMHVKYNDKHVVDITAKVDSSTSHSLTADAQSLLDKLIK